MRKMLTLSEKGNLHIKPS